MKRTFLLQALILHLGAIAVYGQVNMAEMGIASSDSLQKCKIGFFTPGNGGNNRVWDFTQKLSSNETSQVIFLKDSTEVISILGPDRIAYYQLNNGALIHFAGESPTERKDYVIPKLTMKFPLAYGDSIASSYRCDGVYCGDRFYREAGTTTIKVDAIGSVVLAENDTLKDVKRAHTINSYTICMDINYEALDTAAVRQVIEERYEWYLPDSQYPIIEDVVSTTYYDMEASGTTKYAYCNLPEDQVSSYITPVESLEDDEQYVSFEEEQPLPDIIHYRIETHGDIINMYYDLDEDATINTVVASHTGMLYRHNEWTQEAGQDFLSQIDCNGLNSGIYILYINVNGKVYSHKVNL